MPTATHVNTSYTGLVSFNCVFFFFLHVLCSHLYVVFGINVMLEYSSAAKIIETTSQFSFTIWVYTDDAIYKSYQLLIFSTHAAPFQHNPTRFTVCFIESTLNTLYHLMQKIFSGFVKNQLFTPTPLDDLVQSMYGMHRNETDINLNK